MRVRVAAVIALAVVVLSGCSAPAPSPTFGAADAVCSPSLLTDHADTGLTATTAALPELVSPIPELIEAGIPVGCTAVLTVAYRSGDTADFDIALTDAPITDIADQLDAVVAEGEWVRDPAATIWRDPADPGHFIQALEIEEGVLVGVTSAGFDDFDGPAGDGSPSQPD